MDEKRNQNRNLLEIDEQLYLLMMLKTLADENRLTMFRLMNEREYNVGELAQTIGLSEPTISHHLSKLHGAGLLHLRMAGNQRFYRVNEKGLARFKQYVSKIEQMPEQSPQEISDNAWIESLDWDTADKKVLYDYTLDGKLKQLPQREKKWLVILRWLATKFEPDTQYAEKEVNTILTEYHPDYATIRRNLVEYGFMRRERGGGNYWLVEE